MVMWTTATADAICNSSAASSVASLTWEPGNPFYRAFIFVNTISCVVLAASVCTHNVSQVDKLWSVLPSIYAWMCVVDSRTLLMALLSTIWSVRLTYNFHRRGGYSWPPWRGEEDYRWEILRTGKPRLNRAFDQLKKPAVFQLFNVLFISFYQNYLLMYTAAPSFVAWSCYMKVRNCDGESGEARLPRCCFSLFTSKREPTTNSWTFKRGSKNGKRTRM